MLALHNKHENLILMKGKSKGATFPNLALYRYGQSCWEFFANCSTYSLSTCLIRSCNAELLASNPPSLYPKSILAGFVLGSSDLIYSSATLCK